MVGILGDQHMGDERLCGDAVLDDARHCRGLHRRGLAGTATVTRTPGDENAKTGRHDIEPCGDILADDVEITAAADAGPVFDIEHTLDPFEMRRQAATVGLARSNDRVSPCRSDLAARLDRGNSGIEILKAKLKLIFIQLFGAGAEPVPLERGDYQGQSGDLSIGFGPGGLQLCDPIR